MVSRTPNYDYLLIYDKFLILINTLECQGKFTMSVKTIITYQTNKILDDDESAQVAEYIQTNVGNDYLTNDEIVIAEDGKKVVTRVWPDRGAAEAWIDWIYDHFDPDSAVIEPDL